MTRSLKEGLDFIESTVEPIVRLEAIPTDQLKGRVLAEDVVVAEGLTLSAGLALIEADIEEMVEAGVEEAIVYSRPKMVVIASQSKDLIDPHVRTCVDWATGLAARLGVVPLLDCGQTDTIERSIRNNIGADLMLIFPVTESEGNHAAKTIMDEADKEIMDIEMKGGPGPNITVLRDTPCILLPSERECQKRSCLGFLPEVLAKLSRVAEPNEIRFPTIIKGMEPGTSWLLSTTMGGIQVIDPKHVSQLAESDGIALCLDREERGCHLRVIWF